MKKADVKVGHRYTAKVSNRVVTVEILSVAYPRGWAARNLETGREIWIKSAARLRMEVGR